jgi:C4-dicarboxylate transporter
MKDWLERYAAELGTTAPDDEEVAVLLALAGVAAHASERTAAPISCFIAARAGVDPVDALSIAKRLAGSETGAPPDT